MDMTVGSAGERLDALESENRALRADLERLREHEKMYRFLAEASGRLVWSSDPDGKVRSMSRLFSQLTGIMDEERLKDAWIEAIHPDDREALLRRWHESLESGEPYVAEFRARFPDGSVRTLLSRALPSRDAEGRIVRWYGATEDVHDEREAERRRAEAEERYRLAARATNDAIWDYDIAAGTIEWSTAAAEIFGVAGPLGPTPIAWWEERIHPEDRARVLAGLAEAVASRAARWSDTYRVRRDDGSEADVLDRGFIIRDAHGTALRAVGAIGDLTDRNRAEAEIRRMQAELVHVSRLSAMGAMASTLAHELNQPLTAVSNFVRGAARILSRRGEAADPMLVDALQAAEAGALRAGEIVRRLRELVSRGTVAAAVEHLPRLIEEAGVLAFVDERLLGIERRIELDPAAQWVRVDRVQIQQVLINLVRNAFDAMQHAPVRELVVSSRVVTDDLVEVRVADTGTGIAPEHMDSLFSQFMTTKTEGMGIGLPISRTIVEAHGGKIWAENRDGGGAVFCFTLPRAQRGRARAR